MGSVIIESGKDILKDPLLFLNDYTWGSFTVANDHGI